MRTVAFDYDALLHLPPSESLNILRSLHLDGYEVVILSWRAASMKGFEEMVSRLSESGLIAYTDRIDRLVPPQCIYIGSHCISTREESLLTAIKQLSEQEEKE